MRPRLLDLFCGAGGAARGYQLAGFHVIGVDIAPQPNYAGDEFVRADALDVLADTRFVSGFQAVHASPTCQTRSRATAWRGRRPAAEGSHRLRRLPPLRNHRLRGGAVRRPAAEGRRPKEQDVSRYTPPIRRVDTAKGHYYRDATGQRVPGVTGIIGDGLPKPALINWSANTTAEYAVDHWDELSTLAPAQRLKRLQCARYEDKDRGARRGTEVHRAAEKLLAGHEVQVPEEIAGHVESYARFLDEFKVEPVHVEFSCISYRWGYAGTADLCAWVQLPDHGRSLMLLDLKTSRSGIFGETALQLAGYRYADRWVIDGEEVDPEPVEFCGGIHVRGDGYDLIPVEAGEAEFKDLLYAARVGQFIARSRDLVGPPIAPATTSTFRLVREPQQ